MGIPRMFMVSKARSRLSALEDGELLTKGYNVKHQCSLHNDEKEYVQQPDK